MEVIKIQDHIRMEDNLKKLYDTISVNYTLPDYDTFFSDMQSDTNLKALYDNISPSYELPDYETFKSDMGLKKKEATEVPDLLQKPSGVSEEDSQDFILSPDDIAKDFRQKSGETKPVSYEETLADRATISSATKSAYKKVSYNNQRVAEAQGAILREIEDFAAKLNEEYSAKAQKEDADIDALNAEKYWKGQQFLAAKEADMGKRIDEIYDPDSYDNLGKEDVALLKKQVAHIASQPMTFEERDRAYRMLGDNFMKSLSGMPLSYTDPIRKEVNDVINRYSLLNEKGDISMYGWKREADTTLEDIATERGKLIDDFKKEYPTLTTRTQTTPTGQMFTEVLVDGKPADDKAMAAYNEYNRELRLIDVANERLGRIAKFPETVSDSGVATAFVAGGDDLKKALATLGYSDIVKAFQDGSLSRKVQKGEELTPGERAAFDALSVFKAAEQALPPDAIRELTSMGAEMVQFVGQMGLMGAMGVGTKLGLSTFKAALKKSGAKALSAQGAKMIGKEALKVAGTYAAAAPFVPITWERQQQGLAGEQKLNEEGVWEIDKPTVEGWLEATVKGLGTGWSEMVTEAVGEYLPFARMWKGVQKVTGFKISPNNAILKALNTAKINGVPAEIVEELLNIPLQAAVVGDQPLSEVGWGDIWDTVWTTATLTALMGGAAVPGGVVNNIRRARNYEVVNMFGKDNIAAVRDAVISGDKTQWMAAMMGALEGKTADELGMSVGKAAERLSKYATSVAAETVAITQKIDKMPEEGIAGEALAAVAGEQKQEVKPEEQVGGVEDAEGIRAQAEVTGEQAAPGMVKGEEERLGVRDTEEDRVEAPAGTQVKVARTEDGGTTIAAVGQPKEVTPEESAAIEAEFDRLNKLSKGQQVVTFRGNNFPEGMEDKAKEMFSGNADMIGLHLPGSTKSYINLDNVSSVADARKYWVHEAGIHGGLERLFKSGADYAAAMSGVMDAVGEENILKAIDEAGGSADYYKNKPRHMMAEEYLAFLSSKVAADPNLDARKALTGTELTVWQKFVKAINDAITNFFGAAAPVNMTEADINNLIIDSVRTATSKKGAKAPFRGAARAEAEAKAAVTKSQREKTGEELKKSVRHADLTVDKDGNYVFFHYSKERRDVIDPAKYGTSTHGRTSREELAGLSIVGGQMFYTRPDQGEANIAVGVAHVVKAKPSEVYDIAKDPLGFMDEAERRFREARGEYASFDDNAAAAWITQVAQDNGYKMGIIPWGKKGLRAQIARPIKPDETYTEQERIGKNAKADQFRAYQSNRKQGWYPRIRAGESMHPRLTEKWVKEAQEKLANSSMTEEEIRAILDNGTYALLTGENPGGQLSSNAENRKHNRRALAWLRSRDYDPIVIVGKYEGAGENSFLVPNMSLDDAAEFAQEFGQKSVAHSEGYLFDKGTKIHPLEKGPRISYKEETDLTKAEMGSLVKTEGGQSIIFSVNYDFDTTQKAETGVSPEATIANVLQSMRITFPNVKVIVAGDLTDTQKQIEDLLIAHNVTKDKAKILSKKMASGSRGQAIFVGGQPIGVIINAKYARLATAGHEMWHLILNKVFGDNPAKFKEFRDGIDGALRNSGFGDIADQLKEFIEAHYEGQITYEEYLAELGGQLTTGGIKATDLKGKEKTLLEKIKDIINKFARLLTGNDVFLSEATPENILGFMTMISEKVARGENISGYLVEGAAIANSTGIARRRQSISIMKGEESLRKYGIETGLFNAVIGRNTVRRVGEALQARQRAKFGKIGQNNRSVEAEQKIAGWMTREIEYWLDLASQKGVHSGAGWYGKLYQEALDTFSEVFPELKTDQNARDLFTMLAAITSDGQKVMQNFKMAAKAYNSWKDTGKISDDIGALRQASIVANVANLNNLLEQYGGDVAKVKAALLKMDTVKNINAELRKKGLTQAQWPSNFKVPVAAAVLGPKLGMYYANLSGIENYPTLDRWWSRMFNRYRGTLIPVVRKGHTTKGEAIGLTKFKELLGNPEMTDEEAMISVKTFWKSYADKKFRNGTEVEKAANTIYKAAYTELNDAPFNTSDRGFMYNTLKRAVKNLNRRGYNLTIADAQALLWYYEKNLYKELGVVANIEGVSYADAAAESVKKYHAAKNSLDYSVKDNEDAFTVENADDEIADDEITFRNQLVGEEGETENVKRIKSHIRKMVLRAHGVNVAQKSIDRAYNIGAGEQKLILDIESGKNKAALKHAKDTYKQISKFISRALKDARFATKLSRVQTRMIVNEARRVTDLESLQDFFKVVDRVVDNTQYAASMSEARKAQKEIRKRVAAGRYGKDAQMVLDFATMPLRVRDFSMEDLAEFHRVASLLLAGKVPSKGVLALREYKPPAISEPLKVGLNKMIANMEGPKAFNEIYDTINDAEIATPEAYAHAMRAISAVRDRLAELELSDEVLGEMEDRLIALEEELDIKSQEIAEAMEEEKQMLIAESKEMAADVVKENFYPEEWIEVKKLMNITPAELSLMNNKQVFLYHQIMSGLVDGFVNKELYEFIQESDIETRKSAWDVVSTHIKEGYAKIRERGDKLVKMNLGFIARWIDPLRMSETFLANQFNLSKMNVVDQKILGIYNRDVRPIYEKFIAPLYRSITSMDAAVEQVMNKYYAARKKVSHEKRMLLGMVMAEMDQRSSTYVINGQEYTWDTLPEEEKKDIWRWTLENKPGMTHYDTRDMEALRGKLVIGEDGNIDVEASLADLTKDKNVAKLMAVTREVIDSQKGKDRVVTEMRGDVFEDEGPDYLPRMVAETIDFHATKPGEIGNLEQWTSPYRAVRKRAKSTFARTHTRHAIEYDLDRIVGFYVYDVNRDYYLSRPLTVASVALHRIAQMSDNPDIIKVAGALRKSIIDRVKVELTERSRVPFMSRAIGWQRTLSLAQPERPMVEFTANAIRYQIENPKANITKMFDGRWKQVAKEMASPASLKQISRWDSEELGDQRKGPLEAGARLLYTAADTMAGRFVYSNEFGRAFKEKAGKDFDIDEFIENEQYQVDNKEALEYADAVATAMIESLYNSQSWATAPSKHKYVPGTMSEKASVSKKSFAAQTLGYMQSFNFGETEEAMNAIRALARPGVGIGAKANASRRLLNLMTTNYIYMSMRGAFFVMLRSLIDDEDDFAESMANYFSLKNQFKMFIGSVATLGMGRYGGVIRPMISVALGYASYAKMDKETLEFIVNTTNQAIYAKPLSPSERMTWPRFLDQTGIIWAAIAADLTRFGMTTIDFVKQVSDRGFDSLTADQKETWVALSAFNQMLAFALPNFVSPIAERVIRSYMYSVGPSYTVDPGKASRTIGGADIKELYDLDPVSGLTGQPISIYSTGESGDNKREITDSEAKEYQILARNKFDEYVREYVRDNRIEIAADNQVGGATKARNDEVQKDINDLWRKAKSQAKIEMFEYPGAKRNTEYARVARYGALPDPISSVDRTIDGVRVNLLKGNKQLSEELNRAFINLYMEWFSDNFPTEASVSRAKNDITEDGKSRFDVEVAEALKKLRAEAKSQTIK